MGPRSRLSALFALAFLTAASGCSSGYQLTDGAYAGGGNGGYGGSNNPPNDGGSDAGLFDAGNDDGGFIPDSGGCNPVTSQTGCFSIGSTCFPYAGYFNGGCAVGLVCYSYVNDAGVSLNVCCQLGVNGYLCQ